MQNTQLHISPYTTPLFPNCYKAYPTSYSNSTSYLILQSNPGINIELYLELQKCPYICPVLFDKANKFVFIVMEGECFDRYVQAKRNQDGSLLQEQEIWVLVACLVQGFGRVRACGLQEKFCHFGDYCVRKVEGQGGSKGIFKLVFFQTMNSQFDVARQGFCKWDDLYLSPEQLSGEGFVPQKSIIFSFGVMLLHLCSNSDRGRTIYKKDSFQIDQQSMLYKLKLASLKYNYSKSLLDFIKKCLQYQHQKRLDFIETRNLLMKIIQNKSIKYWQTLQKIMNQKQKYTIIKAEKQIKVETPNKFNFLDFFKKTHGRSGSGYLNKQKNEFRIMKHVQSQSRQIQQTLSAKFNRLSDIIDKDKNKKINQRQIQIQQPQQNQQQQRSLKNQLIYPQFKSLNSQSMEQSTQKKLGQNQQIRSQNQNQYQNQEKNAIEIEYNNIQYRGTFGARRNNQETQNEKLGTQRKNSARIQHQRITKRTRRNIETESQQQEEQQQQKQDKEYNLSQQLSKPYPGTNLIQSPKQVHQQNSPKNKDKVKQQPTSETNKNPIPQIHIPISSQSHQTFLIPEPLTHLQSLSLSVCLQNPQKLIPSLYTGTDTKVQGVWAQGDIYYGHFDDQGRRCGRAVEIYANGEYYYGHFQQDRYQGNGFYYWNHGQYFFGVFQAGEKVWGRLEGETRYQGEFYKNKRHGQGTCWYPTGQIYSGYWKNNQRNGQGFVIQPSGSKFVGNWVLGNRRGQGYLQSDNLRIAGFWNGELIQGQSLIQYFNGDVFRGKTGPNLQKVSGQYISKSGNIFNGNFLNDQPKEGVLKYSNGDKYFGELFKMKRHGYGEYYYKSGEVFKGYWENNKRKGRTDN